ncbi:MAG: T9SS type A sorting domain-containing protein [Sphingobacteriia bacterium]|nr:T9SS type A sorting domain-containing protein [Sphingobacteriia bacterium]
MKTKKQFILLVLFSSCFIFQSLAQNSKTVSFWLDMSAPISTGIFDPNEDILDMPGSMNGWNGSMAGNEYQLQATVSPNYYMVSLENLWQDSIYAFKFRINEDWDLAELPGLDNNRLITIKPWVKDVMCVWDVHGVHENFLQANFSADEQLIQAGNTVDFSDMSLGSPVLWQWEFEGGTPSISNSKNPSGIQYNTTGIFSVKLKVQGEVCSNSKEIEGFIKVVDALPQVVWTENFENGWGNWYTDFGTWEVGVPLVGPPVAYNGANCAGTNLNGDYPPKANTRLISPEVIINPEPGETPWLFFYHWFVIETNDDKGFLQISVNHGDWQTVSNPFTGTNQSWSQYGMDLSDYAYSSVRFAFYFTSDGYSNYEGWYIDDIRIEGVVNVGIDEMDYEMATTHPNPFTNKATIKFHNPSHSNYNLSIFNLSGNKVFERDNIKSDKVELKRGNLPDGIYLIELKGEKVFRGKMVVR